MMKKYICIAFLGVFFACDESISLTVENPSDFERNELVEIPTTQIKLTLPQGKIYIVKDKDGSVIPSQVSYDGKLLFQTQINAGEKLNYRISADTPHTYPPKTYGRFAPERKDDFVWENDCVAFRTYGLALKPVSGPCHWMLLWHICIH